MRTLAIAGAAAILLASASAADAQRLGGHSGGGWHGGSTGGSAGGWHGSTGGTWQGGNNGGQWHGNTGGQWHGSNGGHGGQHVSRWGGSRNGRWIGGWNAPGGWGAYRHPSRGWRLPSFWIAPSYFISDYASYGLGAPPYGHNWSRYYDDAVLIDNSGQVWDSVSGVNWDRYDDSDGYDAGYDAGPQYDDGGQGAYYDQSYQQQPGYYDHRDGNGVAGGVAGAVVGGVAGNLIAGRGNRAAGTLIGAGVGAIAGAAIGSSQGRDHYRPAPGYGAGYPQPGYGGGYPQQGYGPSYPPRIAYARPAEVVQPTWSHTETSPAYIRGGYYYPGGTTTTVTVETQPVVTTTTTEYIEESRPVVRKVWRKPVRKWRPRVCAPCTCSCR